MRDFFISVMNKSLIFPSLTVLLQLISMGHLYYTYQNGSSQIPAAFIELIILGAANTVVLIIFYSRFYKNSSPRNFWHIPAFIAWITIIFTLICILLMWGNIV